MSPAAQALAARLTERWDDLAAAIGDAPPPPPEAIAMLRAGGCPVGRQVKEPSR